MSEPPAGSNRRHPLAVGRLGTLQITMGPFHPYAAQVRERRGIQMPAKCSLYAARTQSRGSRDLVKSDGITGMLVDEQQGAAQRLRRIAWVAGGFCVERRVREAGQYSAIDKPGQLPAASGALTSSGLLRTMPSTYLIV